MSVCSLCKHGNRLCAVLCSETMIFSYIKQQSSFFFLSVKYFILSHHNICICSTSYHCLGGSVPYWWIVGGSVPYWWIVGGSVPYWWIVGGVCTIPVDCERSLYHTGGLWEGLYHTYIRHAHISRDCGRSEC